MSKIAVFASGNGSNFQSIVESSKEYDYNVDILVCNQANAFVIERANSLGIETYIFNHKDYKDRSIYEKEIINYLKVRDVKLIVLAGYMRLLSKTFLDEYEGRIINIHPSMLPDYPGINSIEDAYNDKASNIGVTIFYVDSGVDTGKIIEQSGFTIVNKSLEKVRQMTHELEHELYPKTIQKVLEEQ